MRPEFRDLRLALLALAFVFSLLALFGPSMSITHKSFDALVIVDITGSMNTRDYQLGSQPVSRLDFVKTTLLDFIARLPCSSRVGLGVFSERRSFLLYEPIEVCANYAPIAGSIDALDWRMAWEGDSRVAAGLFRAVEMARGLQTDLLFFTDGQEAPPLPFTGPPPFEGRVGDVKGVIVGVGGYELSPIPKFDDNGREIGFYGVEDVPHDNRHGLPPPGAEQREGYNARNAPFGGAVAVGVEHLSSVRESYLQSLSGSTGLAYAHLTNAETLVGAFETVATSRGRVFEVSLRPFYGGAAGVALVWLFVLLPAFEWLRAHRLRARRKDWSHHTRYYQRGETYEKTMGGNRSFNRLARSSAWPDAHQS